MMIYIDDLLTGKHDACCYISGIEVDSFEGMDAWKKEYEQFISKISSGDCLNSSHV